MRVLVRPDVCSTCPFKGKFHLGKARREEIAGGVTEGGAGFLCHSEYDYYTETPGRECAGAATVALREGTETRAMQIQQRLTGVDIEQSDAVPFMTWAEWINEEPNQ